MTRMRAIAFTLQYVPTRLDLSTICKKRLAFHPLLHLLQSAAHLGSRRVALPAIGVASLKDDGIQVKKIRQTSVLSQRGRDFWKERRIATGTEHEKHHAQSINIRLRSA